MMELIGVGIELGYNWRGGLNRRGVIRALVLESGVYLTHIVVINTGNRNTPP